MADPPFSTDPHEDVPAGDADYVRKINDNFGRSSTEIKDLDSRLKSATGSGTFDPFLEQGQMEVNGNFRLHRRMQEVSRIVGTPGDGPIIPNADFLVVDTGVGLGIVGGGAYTYHPTVCPGWYAPLDIMPAIGGAAVDGFGDEPASGGFGMQINFPAAARLNGATDESVIFQPLSVHNPAARWAGRALRAQIEYEHDAAVGVEPEIYAAWDVGGVRTFSHAMFTVSSAILGITGLGTTNTLTFDFTPPVGATMLEIGIRIRDPLAHSFVFRRFIVSTNLNRSLALAHPGIIPSEQVLIDSHYFRSVQGKNGVDFVPAVAVMTVGAAAEKRWPADDRRPVITPGQYPLTGVWDAVNSALYAKPILVTQSAPHSGVLIARTTDGCVVDLVEKVVDQGSGGFANYDDWKSLAALYGTLSFATVVAAKDFNPDWMIEYDGEWLSTFRPLLLP